MDVATRVLGARGAALIAAGVAISSLGFLSQSILTAPRVYFAMAEDGVFLRSVARVHPRTRVPVVAIDFIFFALTASCLFVFRRRGETVQMPGHPLTTLAFIAVCAAVVIATFRQDPVHSLAGLALTSSAGLPVYLLWRRNA
jgi:APA family basic amino acid/polyamine antiporter